jgi:hypothetical protein
MSYIKLRSSLYDIFLNLHAPTEEKCNYTKDSFYEEPERVLKYHMKILLEDFSVKVEREDISKQTIGNESLH